MPRSERLQSDAAPAIASVEALQCSFQQCGYVAEHGLCSVLKLLATLGKPLLVEGEAGVGKTELARCLSVACGSRLIRLQCYEGLDAQHALYDWDYRRQLLTIQMAAENARHALGHTLYSEEFLLKRPILAALLEARPAVLLIDEIDRADEQFEALLLEVLADFQVSIPEYGTLQARSRPYVIVTSNGVRELSDALRRRCLYHYIDYPDAATEQAIVRARLPGIDQALNAQLVRVVQRLRTRALRKTPGIAETLDWAAALLGMGVQNLAVSIDSVEPSLSCLLKTREDRHWFAAQLADSSLTLNRWASTGDTA